MAGRIQLPGHLVTRIAGGPVRGSRRRLLDADLVGARPSALRKVHRDERSFRVTVIKRSVASELENWIGLSTQTS